MGLILDHGEDRGVWLMLSFDIDIDVAIFWRQCKRGLGDTGVNSTTGPLAQQCLLQGVNILGFVFMILVSQMSVTFFEPKIGVLVC